MHLLTLLIAAAFASQFRAPNIIEDFDVTSPTDITSFELMTKLPAIVITYTNETGGRMSNAVGDRTWKLTADGVTAEVTFDDAEYVTPDDTAKTFTIKAGLEAGALIEDDEVPDEIEINVEEVTEVPADPDPPVIATHTATLPVVAAEAFTLSEDEITVEALTGIPALDITCADVRGWLEAGMPAKYTVKDSDEFVETTITYDDDTWTVAAVEDITDLELVWGDLPVTLVLSFGVEVGGVVVEYPETAELVLTPDPAFDVTPATITPEDIGEAVVFTIKPLNITLAATDKAFVTVDASPEPTSVNFTVNLVQVTPNVAYTATLDLTDLDIDEETTELHFWVLANDEVLTPFVIKYDAEVDPVGAFIVEPTEVEFADRATAGPFIFTNGTLPADPTTWVTPMKAKFTGSAGTQEFDVEDDDGEWTTGKIDISTLVGAQGGAITVELAPAGTKYIPEMTKTITVKAPVAPASFLLKPTEITEEEEEVLLSAEPEGDDDDWEGKVVSCIWTFTEEPPQGAVEGLTFVLEKNESERNQDTPYAYQATIDMTEVEIPDDKDYIYAWIMLEEPGEDKNQVQPTILEGYVRITYTRNAEDLSFTIDPKETKWVAALKTPLITIKPSDPEQMPKDEAETFVAKFTKTVTGGTDLEVPVEVKIDKTATPFKYTIPKDADLADLAIKEADCPVTLKVSLWNDTDEIGEAQNFKVVKDEPEPEAAMGVSPLLSLLAAALLLLVKLF